MHAGATALHEHPRQPLIRGPATIKKMLKQTGTAKAAEGGEESSALSGKTPLTSLRKDRFSYN